MHQSSFPYHYNKVINRTKRAVPLKNRGIEIQTNPNSWITGGPMRNIEKGLPIIGTPIPALDPNKPTPMDNFVSILVDKPYLKNVRKMYGTLEKKHPEIDFNDPDNLTNEEKQFIYENSQEVGEQLMRTTTLKVTVRDKEGEKQTTTQIPMNAHLQTFGGKIPYFNSEIFDVQNENVVEVVKRPPKKRTGIYGQPNEVDNVSSSLIRNINFRTISKKESERYRDGNESALRPLTLPQHSLSKTLRDTQINLNTHDTAVKECIETYFQPDQAPFVPKNVENVFPLMFGKGDMNMYLEEEESKEAAETPDDLIQSLSNSEKHRNVSTLILNESELMKCDPKSTLIDTSDQDVLFTKKKAPFRRVEIARMKAFQSHWDNLKIEQNKKFEERMRERDIQVHKAFQSRKVMETYMKLLQKEYVRCRSGLIGKSPFKNKSMWQVALETAPEDPTALGVRMEFWWRFCAYVSKANGVKTENEREVALTLRSLLMDNHAVNKSLFKDLINELDKELLQIVGPLKLLEFVRICLKVDQKVFQKCIELKKVSLLIYSQTILTNMSSELVELMMKVSKMKIKVPDPTDLI